MKQVLIKRIILFFLFLNYSNIIYSQNISTYVLLDSITKAPVKYANILKYNNQGTITNEDGYFYIYHKEEKKEIKISHIGYKEKTILISKLKDTILFSPKIYVLDEVILVDYKNIFNKAVSKLKNRKQEDFCENFYYKEFLKQNKNYVNYMEATGIRITKNNEHNQIFIKDKRATNDLIDESINFKFVSLYSLLNRFREIINNIKIVKYNMINKDILRLTGYIKNKKENYNIYVNMLNKSILKIEKNNLNNQLNISATKSSFLSKKKYHIYQQGNFYSVDFIVINNQSYLNKINFIGKATVLNNKNPSKLTYMSEQIYLVKNPNKNCKEYTIYKELNKNGNILKAKSNRPVKNWNLERTILPTEKEALIFKNLKWDD